MPKATGIAAKLTSDGDFELKTTPGGALDLVIIEGVDEVAQAIHIRLQTIMGEDILAPFYGLEFDELVGTFDEALAAFAIRSCILQDLRVASVDAIETSLDGRTRKLETSVEITLKDGTALTIAEQFGF